MPSEKTYSISGVSKFLSVPYSLYSKKSGNGIASISDNNNGTLTFNFLDGSKYISPILKGITGPQGPIGLTGPQGIKGDKGDKGDTGAQGLKGDVGPIGLTGATGANGTNGVNGQNTLVKTTTETAGPNCSTGGVKVEYGLDVNNNGTLDVNEINSQLTRYVCNGAVGPQGSQGVQGPIGLIGATGPKGDVGLQGLKGDKGDVGATGLTGATGPAGANGKNTLVKTTTESVGANCTIGGVKVEYGLDVNNNGTLDAGEINTQLTKYVCNGAVGAQGPIGLTGATGPKGDIGLQGLKGDKGDVGATGLTGATGLAGANGTNGSNGVDGKNTLVKITTESAGANCSTGGVKVEYGLDANNNVTLDAGEININLTKYVCNGAVGAQGIQGPQGVAGAPGAQGPIGLTGATGPKGDIGLQGLKGDKGDVGATGLTGATGPAGTNGLNGADGKNTLVKTSTELAGVNCITGGVKVEYGLDVNNNGTLDAGEININFTKYVCNGAVGPQGIQGAQGPIGLTGATGPKGDIGLQGLKGDKGDKGDVGTTGPQGVQGLTGTSGTNGVDGKNTLVKTTTELAGVNCSTGGLKVEYGLDANNNGTLDVSEININLTKYVCNGAVGAQGIQGPQGIAGAPGTQGPIGLAGATGPKGDIGLQGLKGDKGDVGATGPQGVQGLTGTSGTNGVDGKNTLVKTTTELAGVNCITGGVKVEYGLDANNNGTLDAGEINTQLTNYVCNGAVGAQGSKGDTGLTGAQGLKGDTGLPGATGPKGDQGVSGLKGEVGATGSSGKNTLVKTSVEPNGANCSTGGTKLEYGLDANGNNILDLSEINAGITNYLCNGLQGPKGDQGVQGPKGDKGDLGATGPQGLQGEMGPQGPAGTTGTTGSNGQTTLVNTTTEAAGANCSAGGVKMEYGLDANANGILDAIEINATLTKYVCNGSNASSNVNQDVMVGISASTNWTCPTGVTQIMVEVWGGGGAYGQMGGRGGYNRSSITVIPGNVYNVVIGNGGNAAKNNAANSSGLGSDGGSTSFGVFLSASGGTGGSCCWLGGSAPSGATTNWPYSDTSVPSYIPSHFFNSPSTAPGGSSTPTAGAPGFCIIRY